MRSAIQCRWLSCREVPELEILPHSTVRRLNVRPREKQSLTSTIPSDEKQHDHKMDIDKRPRIHGDRHPPDGPRMNEMNVQMLSTSLHRQIFPRPSTGQNQPAVADSSVVQVLHEELLRHGIDVSRSVVLPDVNFKLPRLRGANIEEHFRSIAEEQSEPYRRAINALPLEIPDAPKNWSKKPGWTQYDASSGEPKGVPFPDELALVFDVEVCVPAGPAPVMATAFGSSGNWYSWTSVRLMGEGPNVNKRNSDVDSRRYQPNDLIPLESDSCHNAPKRGFREQFGRPRIVIGHNVSYDRARVREQYWLEPTAIRFLDTMSLHVCVSGVTSYQRAMLRSRKRHVSSATGENEEQGWSEHASLNNLADVYALYSDGDQLVGKSRRNTFVEGTLDDVRGDFTNLMSYCAEDVRATRTIMARLWPLFCERFPHPATLSGMLEMGSAYLPVNANWTRYLTEADLAFEDLDLEAKHLLSQRADAACSLLHDAAYRRDLWLWDQDWSVQTLKLKVPSAILKRKNGIADAARADGNTMQLTRSQTVALPLEQNAEEERLASKFAYLYDSGSRLPARRPLLPGYPAWYRKLCSKPTVTDENDEWHAGPASKLGTGMQIAPKLLSLCWEGYPLHYIRGHGWGFLVPHRCGQDSDGEGEEEREPEPRIPLEQLAAACPVVEVQQAGASRNESNETLQQLWKNVETTISRKEYYDRRCSSHVGRPQAAGAKQLRHYAGSGVWCDVELGACCYFLQLPHKDGIGHRVGNPLSKDFLAKFSENILAGDGRAGERVVEIARMLSYWRNNRERIRGQLVVWNATQPGTKSQADYGAIVPQVVVCGTLTRRSMEPTWMTASNAQRERIGSELRAMVQAPAGYRFVGADVDSQELWIASVLGDADVAAAVTGSGTASLHGVTPFGWMTLSGSKATRTDMHSVTAAAVGISRDHAKVINYARIYGAGPQFAERLLKQFNPTFSEAEARSKAVKMFSLTKGRKVYRLRDAYRGQFADAPPHSTAYEALRLARICNRAVGELFHSPRWVGGTESAMFNRLERIAGSGMPATPFLGGRLTRALEPQPGVSGSDDRFLPTRINWVVQSGAVDFLHLMLVCMRWLMGSNGQTRLRFCLSFHDEVRYLVPERYADHAALAMHVTNLLTRSFCAYRVGFRDLPQSVAFFTTVEIDRVLRKEAQHDCRTPSNPHGLRVGYGIPDGESLDIYQTLARLGPKRCDMRRWEWHRPSDPKKEAKR